MIAICTDLFGGEAFYVDDCLGGADSISEAIDLQAHLHFLFSKGGFLLRKWNSSEAEVLSYIPSDLKDAPAIQLHKDSWY